MRRQSDIGWTELIIGIILIIFGLFIVRQPVGIITWIVIVCGVLAILTGIADIILYVRMERKGQSALQGKENGRCEGDSDCTLQSLL